MTHLQGNAKRDWYLCFSGRNVALKSKEFKQNIQKRKKKNFFDPLSFEPSQPQEVGL